MAEWFKAAVLKTVDVNSVRRFESCVLRHCMASAHDKKAGAFFFALQSRTCFAVGPVFASGAGRFAARSCKPAAAAPNPVSSANTWRQHMIKRLAPFSLLMQSRTCFAVGPVFASGAGRFAAHSCKPAAAAPNPVSSAIAWRQHMARCQSFSLITDKIFDMSSSNKIVFCSISFGHMA